MTQNPNNKSGDSFGELVTFDFYGDEIDVLQRDDSIWVSVKRICESLGLDDRSQRKKLLATTWAEFITTKLQDRLGRQQETLLIGLDWLPMWLATVSINKVSVPLRHKLGRYQKEAAKTLRDRFLGNKMSIVPATMPKESVEIQLLRRKCSVEVLSLLKEKDQISDDYFSRHVGHDLAIIRGTEVEEGDRLIDVNSYLEGKGFCPSLIRKHAGNFGKALRKAYVDLHGHEPGKVIRFINGSERFVNSYTERDLPLFHQVFEKMFGSTRMLPASREVAA